MSNINGLTSGHFYQLSDPSQSANNATTSASGASPAPILAAPSSGKDTASGNGGSSSYLLNLSKEAQDYIASLSAAAGTTSSSTGSGDEKFVLSAKQQATINSILANYKDAPYTQETYQAIQSDLADAGLSTDALAAKEKVRSINPTQMFLTMLNGGDSKSVLPAVSDESLKKKSDNYMDSIIDQWSKMSTTILSSGETSA